MTEKYLHTNVTILEELKAKVLSEKAGKSTKYPMKVRQDC